MRARGARGEAQVGEHRHRRIAKRGMKARARVFAEDAKEAMGRLGS